MSELDKDEVVKKLINIAKKNLKPAKKNENLPIQANWRFEISPRNLRTISLILLLSAIFSGIY